MKKILSLMLVICLLCGVMMLTACGEAKPKIPETAYELFTAATEKTQALDSYHGVMTVGLGVNMMGITLTMPMNMIVMAEGLKTENPKTAINMNMDILGQSVDMDIYSDGEWAYVVALDQAYKTPIVDDQNNYSDYINTLLQELPEELFADTTVTVDENGIRSFETAIESDTFKTAYSDFITEMINTAIGAAGGIDSISINDAKLAVSVAEDLYFSKYSIEFGLRMAMSGSEIEMTVTTDLTYIDPGQPVTVTFPEGYENFMEIDASGM